MISLVLDLLAMDDFKGGGENIDIAKGKYEIPLTIKKAMRAWQRQ